MHWPIRSRPEHYNPNDEGPQLFACNYLAIRNDAGPNHPNGIDITRNNRDDQYPYFKVKLESPRIRVNQCEHMWFANHNFKL